MNLTKLFLCLWLVPLLPCKAQRLIYPDSVPVEEIRVSPDHAMGGNVSDYLEDIQYFKLEKPRKGWIDHIWYTYTVGGRLILIDDMKGEIYIYTKEGKLIRNSFISPDVVKANRLTNNVDNRSLYLSDHRKEQENHEGITLDGDRYDLRGEWQEELVLFEPISFESCVKLDDKTWAFYQNPYNTHFRKMDAPVLLRTDTDGTFAPLLHIDTLSNNFQKVQMSMSSGFFTSVLNGEMVAHYSHPFSYEVVEIRGNRIDKVYKFVLPQKHTVPENIYELSEYKERGELAYFQDIEQNYTLIANIRDVIRYVDYLIFQFTCRKSCGSFYAYSLTDKEFVNMSRLVPDDSNGFMPLFSRNTSRLFSDGEYLYSLVYARNVNEHIRDFYEREKRTVPAWIKDLANYDNPILVRFKLK